MESEDFMERKAAMKEIRARWNSGLHDDDDDDPADGGIWFPDSPDNRGQLMVIIQEGNGTYGDGTHWLEEREA